MRFQTFLMRPCRVFVILSQLPSEWEKFGTPRAGRERNFSGQSSRVRSPVSFIALYSPRRAAAREAPPRRWCSVSLTAAGAYRVRATPRGRFARAAHSASRPARKARPLLLPPDGAPSAPERAASDRPVRRPATRVGAALPWDTALNDPTLVSSPHRPASSPARRARVDARGVVV